MPDLELEFTYLAKSIPPQIDGVTPKEIIDVYIPEAGVDHPNLRARKNGDTYEITKKIPVHGLDSSRMHEYTIPLNRQEFEALQTASNRLVIKDRYKVIIDGRDAEVDVFKDNLAGLVLIDFEFATVSDQMAFTPPRVCLCDVTQDEFVAGGMLAGKTYKDIEPELAKRHYMPLTHKIS